MPPGPSSSASAGCPPSACGRPGASCGGDAGGEGGNGGKGGEAGEGGEAGSGGEGGGALCAAVAGCALPAAACSGEVTKPVAGPVAGASSIGERRSSKLTCAVRGGLKRTGRADT